MCMEKKEKNRKVKKIYIYMWRKENKNREEKERRGVERKIWEGWIKWKEKNKSVRKDVTLLRDETFTLFPTMCNPTTRTSSMPRSHNSFALAHVHHSKSSHPWYPHIWFILMIIGFEW
jgi:hypothetical protein